MWGMPQNLPRVSLTMGEDKKPDARSEESTMETLLGALAFTAFMLAQVAAVVTVHAERDRRQPYAATRQDLRTRAVSDCGD